VANEPDPYEQSSLCVWYPVLAAARLPQPDTVIVPCSLSGLLPVLDSGAPFPALLLATLQEAGRSLGYPLFLRTDHRAAKFDYHATCHVASESELVNHCLRLADETICAGSIPLTAFVARRMLDLCSSFRAFYGLPIAVEFRAFTRDSRVTCLHPYWTEDVIRRSFGPKPPDWPKRLREQNLLSRAASDALGELAVMAAAALGGSWSIDFAMDRDLRWWLIDAARAEASWHDPKCPHARRCHGTTLTVEE
jgi:hypothetical protein